jgi:predicted enzyme related to lactoylglutathione lyase
MAHGVVHFEIPADEPEKLVDFYTNLFGWQIQKYPMPGGDYWGVMTTPSNEQGMPEAPGAINGGLYKRQMPGQQPVNYVAVENVDEYADKAKGLGASVVVEKQAVPQMGWFAVITDPQGNMLGLWQDDTAAA